MPARQRPPQSTTPAEDAAALDAAGPATDGDNAFLQTLIRKQLEAQPAAGARGVLFGARDATRSVIVCDSSAFGTDMDELKTSLSSFLDGLADIRTRGDRIDTEGADVDLDAEVLGDLVGQLDAADDAFDDAFDPATGLGFWLWPTSYKDTPLVGMYDREGQLPDEETGGAGWIQWLADRRIALQDLLDRADTVRTFGEENLSALTAAGPSGGIWALIEIGTPPDLKASAGREHQYLIEVLRETWPDWAVAPLERSRGELQRESEALDTGVDPTEIAGLDALVGTLSDLDTDAAVAAVADLGPAQRRYVLTALRAQSQGGDSVYADLVTHADPSQAAILSVGAGDEGLDDTNSMGQLGLDMARGAPGATANVGWGMVRSLPILGDVLHWGVGDDVDAGLAHMNQAWLGMDAESSDQQRAIGQIGGQLAGTVGMMAIAGPTAAAEGVAAKVPTAARLGLFGMDTANGAYQGLRGETVTGEELPWWSRALALAGAGVNVASGARALKAAPVATAREARGAAEIAARDAEEYATDPDLAGALAEFLPQMAAKADDAKALARSIELQGYIGQGLTGLGRGSATIKPLLEGVDEEEEQESLGLDSLLGMLGIGDL